MKVLFDTSAIIELERKSEILLRLVELLLERDAELYISSISISEIFTGVFLYHKEKERLVQAREFLGQFEWKFFDFPIAEETGRIFAELIRKGKSIDFRDCAIGATAITTKSNVLLTTNKKDFINQGFKGDILSPHELLSKLS